MPRKKKRLPPGVRERDGRYTFRYSVEVVKDGKRVRKQKETPAYDTPEEAYKAGILIKADQLQGRLVDPKNVTLEAWCERWLEDYKIEREPRGHTIENRRVATNSFKKYIGEQTRLKDIAADDYQRWLNQLKRNGRKKGTIREYHIAVKLMFSDAARKEFISINPASSAILPVFKKNLAQIESGNEELPKFMEKEELKHFLQIVRFRGSQQDHNIFTVLAYTGMRIGELLALKTNDFDEVNQIISITKTLTTIGGVKKYTLGPPKKEASIRLVTISKTVIESIKRQLAWRDKRIADDEALHKADFIFWSPRYPGYPMPVNGAEYNFRKFIKLAGLPVSLTPHNLRHTHVSLLAEAGEELAVIQERLGHENDDTTRRIYLHVTKEQKKRTPDRFEKIMS